MFRLQMLGEPDWLYRLKRVEWAEGMVRLGYLTKADIPQLTCTAYESIVHPETREVVLAKGEPVSREKMDELEALGVDQIKIYW